MQHACKIDDFFASYTRFLTAKTQQTETEIITNFEFRLWEVAVCSRSFFFSPFVLIDMARLGMVQRLAVLAAFQAAVAAAYFSIIEVFHVSPP